MKTRPPPKEGKGDYPRRDRRPDGSLEHHTILPLAKMQIAPAPDASTVKEVAAGSIKPKTRNVSLKSNCRDVFAAIAIGPIKAVVTAPPVSPAPMVIEIAFPPLLTVK